MHPSAAPSTQLLFESGFPQQEKSSRGERRIISFPGVSSLETPGRARSRGRPATGPAKPPQPLGQRVGEPCPGGDPRCPPLPPPAWLCPLWAAVEALGWGIPALQGERVHATACGSLNFSPRSAEPVATRGRACGVSGFPFFLGSPGLVSCIRSSQAR